MIPTWRRAPSICRKLRPPERSWLPRSLRDPIKLFAGGGSGCRTSECPHRGEPRKVGIKVKIRPFTDVSEFYKQLRQGKMEGLTLLAWGNGASFDADAVYYPLFHTGQPHAYNTSPELDKLLDDGRATSDLRNARRSTAPSRSRSWNRHTGCRFTASM